MEKKIILSLLTAYGDAMNDIQKAFEKEVCPYAGQENPMDILKYLQVNNVEACPIWKLMHMQTVFRDRDFISTRELPVAGDSILRDRCLPSDIKMTEVGQDYVNRLIHECS